MTYKIIKKPDGQWVIAECLCIGDGQLLINRIVLTAKTRKQLQRIAKEIYLESKRA